jgi:DGQHR domain-containing protein
MTKKKTKRKSADKVLRVPAIEIRQGTDHRLYSFSVDGKLLPQVATISRVRRDDKNTIEGYQRPEVASHISEIRRYIESDNPMIPNALVVAFDGRVKFKASAGSGGGVGELIIPLIDGADDADLPGWVVDGQQRSAAIREARVDSFPVFVTAFITDSEEDQRAQFILVNNTKPLPKGLIYELLPATNGSLPTILARRRFPALLLGRLNHDHDSPFRGRIKTPTNGDGVIKDNSVLRMIENSLRDGALYRHWDSSTGSGDVDAMLVILKAYWSAIERVFPDAWNGSPRRSRLVHGVGIVSMGLLMDAATDGYRDKPAPSVDDFERDLREIEDACRWCSGYWEFGPRVERKWNELQNTSKDIQMLANYLLTLYKHRVWDRTSQCV